MRPAILFLCGIGMFAMLGSSAELYRVAGTVVNTETLKPLAGARVEVRQPGVPKPLAAMATGADGKFGFDLPEGVYLLMAGPRDLPQAFGPRVPGVGLSTAVITGPGKDTANLIFRWFPPAGISGKVVDEYGEPVESALVHLLRSAVVGGKRKVGLAGFIRTNDLGEYRFGPLPGGAYYLTVTATPWYSGHSQSDDDRFAFLPSHYPGTPDPQSAAPLTVKPGEEARADFALRSSPGARVVVRYDSISPEIECVCDLIGRGVAGSDQHQARANMTGGMNRIDAAPPGPYTVQLVCKRGDDRLFGTQDVTVTAPETTVSLTLHPAPSVSGTVQTAAGASERRGSLLLALRTEDGEDLYGAAVRPDGSFRIPAVVPGKYRPSLVSRDGYVAADIRVEGAAFRDGILDLSGARSVTMRIAASDKTGRIKGFAVSGDQPMEGAMVVLAPAAGSADAAGYLAYQSDSDGSFDFENVPAGDYLLFALDDASVEYASPDGMRPYVAGAKRIRVEKGGVYTEKAPVTKAIAPTRN